MSVKISSTGKGLLEILARLKSPSVKSVTVGIHGDEDSELLKYAAAHEFGLSFTRKGGVSYGFKSKKDLNANKVRFLKKGQGVFEMGVTRDTEITMPQRSFIRQTFDKFADELKEKGVEFSKAVGNGKITLEQALQFWGEELVTLINSEINDGGNFEPNSPATIRKKGAGKHPLQDSGRLQQSIKAVVS